MPPRPNSPRISYLPALVAETIFLFRSGRRKTAYSAPSRRSLRRSMPLSRSVSHPPRAESRPCAGPLRSGKLLSTEGFHRVGVGDAHGGNNAREDGHDKQQNYSADKN